MNWKEFWNKQETPLNRENNKKWYKLYAGEINLLYKLLDVKNGNVLETGCGDGQLFEHFDFIKKEYVGIDYSKSLLDRFKEAHPSINLIESDASKYKDNTKYSFIFSTGVIQYFDKQMLDEYIKNSLEMLEDGGVLLMSNIPNSLLRFSYNNGELSSKLKKRNKLKSFLIALYVKYTKRNLGHWYRPNDFLQYGDDLDIKIFGSIFYPYRFSVAITKK
jgi:cyclopropane fatty-acyl-phospholipid synthase-like methyltransferase